MKRKVLAILVPALLMAGAAHAAEMYNKMVIKLICTVRSMRVIPSLITLGMMAMKPMYKLVSKAKHKSLTMLLVMASGNIKPTPIIPKTPVILLLTVWRTLA